MWFIFILRIEEIGFGGIRIVNLFFFFELFEDKFVVYLLIGFVGDFKFGNKKGIVGKKGKKGGIKFVGNGKSMKLRMKVKDKE